MWTQLFEAGIAFAVLGIAGTLAEKHMPGNRGSGAGGLPEIGLGGQREPPGSHFPYPQDGKH